MKGLSTKSFGTSLIFKGLYAFAALLFVLLCAYRLALLFSPRPGVLPVLAVSACLCVSLVLVCRSLKKTGGKAEAAFYSLSAAFFWTYGFALCMEVDIIHTQRQADLIQLFHHALGALDTSAAKILHDGDEFLVIYIEEQPQHVQFPCKVDAQLHPGDNPKIGAFCSFHGFLDTACRIVVSDGDGVQTFFQRHLHKFRRTLPSVGGGGMVM